MTAGLSRIGHGCSALGNLTRVVTEDEAQAVLDAAFERGIRYFDTSPLYGYGLSELRLGSFIRRVGRHGLMLSTKVGRTLEPAYDRPYDKGIWYEPLPAIATIDYSYEGTLRSLEQSFSRTGISDFDRVFIHDLDPSTHGDAFERRLAEAIEGAYRALADMKAAGHIREIGIGVNDSMAVERVLDHVSLDCVMLAGEYTLYRQPAASTLFPRLRSMADPPALILCGVFNSGALADPARNRNIDYRPAERDEMIRLERLAALAERYSVSLRDAALQFALRPDVVKQVVVGASRPGQVRENIDALTQTIPDEFWIDLKVVSTAS